jgi:hypothetical protein
MTPITRTIARLALLFACVGVHLPAATEPGILPIFVADNHADSLAFLAERLNLEEPHLLVLVDAHSDATAAARSDDMRRDLRRVRNIEERRSKVESWRENGRLQAYNWIEPLMPRPLDKLVWVASPKLDELQRRRLEQEAGDFLDARIEFESRTSGSLADRFTVADAGILATLHPEPRATVLSLDLDYFASMSKEDSIKEMEHIWSAALTWPFLRAVTVAVSRPWQNDDAQAATLLSQFFDLAGDVPGARFIIEHRTRSHETDNSQRARQLAAEGKAVPRWAWNAAPPSLAVQLSLLKDRLLPWAPDDDWPLLQEHWQQFSTHAHVDLEDTQSSLDGIWRLDQSRVNSAVLRIKDLPKSATYRASWWLLQPRSQAYDLLPESGLGKRFTKAASPWIAERRAWLAETTDAALPLQQLSQTLATQNGLGRVRILAEMETAHGWLPLPVFELRVTTGQNFHAALAEQMGMPYVFGIGLAAVGELTGADLAWGNDCANFLVHAWRRQGWRLPWCSPGQLRSLLEVIAEPTPAKQWKPVALPPGALEHGVVVDLGPHMAAVWKDRNPKGILDHNDLVVHHLSGPPSIITLGELLKSAQRVSILRNPPPNQLIAFGGDVVLTDATRQSVQAAFKDQPQTEFSIINLEGIPSLRNPTPEQKSRFDFRFEPTRLRWLTEQKVNAVCLANNHALDAGQEGLKEGLQAIRQAGLQVFGAGENLQAALTPARLNGNKGENISVFGVVCLPWMTAADDQPGVCVLPQHQHQLAAAMHTENEAGRQVIVMVHWGNEYQNKITQDQRHWARWLIDHGAITIVGSHPHVTQMHDSWQGCSIWFSLGNLVYPSHLNALGSHQWAIWPSD